MVNTMELDIRVLYKSNETEQEDKSVNLSIIGCLHLLGVLYSSVSSAFIGMYSACRGHFDTRGLFDLFTF